MDDSKFGLPNLKIGQIPSLGTTYTPKIVLKYIERHQNCVFACYPQPHVGIQVTRTIVGTIVGNIVK